MTAKLPFFDNISKKQKRKVFLFRKLNTILLEKSCLNESNWNRHLGIRTESTICSWRQTIVCFEAPGIGLEDDGVYEKQVAVIID